MKKRVKKILTLVVIAIVIILVVLISLSNKVNVSFSPTEVSWKPGLDKWYSKINGVYTSVANNGTDSATKSSDALTSQSNGAEILWLAVQDTFIPSDSKYIKTKIKYSTSTGYDSSRGGAYYKLFFKTNITTLSEGTYLQIKNTNGEILSDERIFKIPSGATKIYAHYLRTLGGGRSVVNYYGADYEFLNPSCQGHCGTYYEYPHKSQEDPATYNDLGCSCDKQCSTYGDCCGDYGGICDVLQNNTCIDSDGLNFYNRGNVTLINSSGVSLFYDSCISTIVQEHECFNITHVQTIYDCGSEGKNCSNGACV